MTASVATQPSRPKSEGVFSCFVVGKPAAQGSKKHIGNGILVESSHRLKPWRTDVKESLAAVVPANWDRTGAMKLVLDFVFLRPKSHYTGSGFLTKRAPVYPIGRVGDIDKIARAVLDAATHIAFDDDSQVIELVARKSYAAKGDNCGVWITVERVTWPYA